MSPKLVIPQFRPHFEEIRNNPDKHLTMKKPDGSFMVSQDEIDSFAKDLLADEFYVEPWLSGSSPATVLFPEVIDGLGSEDAGVRRNSVNSAYNAEFRINKMGIDSFIDWVRNGRNKNELVSSTEDYTGSKEFRKISPRKSSMSLTKLTLETREAIEKVYNNKNLLGEMPESLRKRFHQAHEDIENGQMFEEFGQMTMEVFEQWRVGRKQITDLSRLIPEAIDQREEMLANYSHSAVAVAHCAKLVGAITDPKKLSKLLKEGIAIQERLSIPLDLG